MSNEAAERLRVDMMQAGLWHQNDSVWFPMFDAALAAERKATVEKVRAALKGHGFSPISKADMEWIGWRLDEVAE